jgi:hypothetical protein
MMADNTMTKTSVQREQKSSRHDVRNASVVVGIARKYNVIAVQVKLKCSCKE